MFRKEKDLSCFEYNTKDILTKDEIEKLSKDVDNAFKTSDAKISIQIAEDKDGTCNWVFVDTKTAKPLDIRIRVAMVVPMLERTAFAPLLKGIDTSKPFYIFNIFNEKDLAEAERRQKSDDLYRRTTNLVANCVTNYFAKKYKGKIDLATDIVNCIDNVIKKS